MNGSDADPYDAFVFRRLLDEVYLLMDYVSGHPDKSIAKLADIRLPDTTETKVAADDVLTQICMLRYPPDEMRPVNARNAAFLLLVKDRLNALAQPAIGMTIAFTALVVGAAREPVTSAGKPAGRRTTTRYSLAAEAYPGLIRSAARLRFFIIAGISAMLLLTAFTAYTSGVVAFGKSMLERIAEVNRLGGQVSDSIRALETTPPAGAIPGTFYRLCDRPKVLVWNLDKGGHELPTSANADTDKPYRVDVFDNAVERQVCDQLADVNRKQQIVYQNLTGYEDRYLYLYQLPITLLGDGRAWIARQFSRTPEPACAAGAGQQPGCGQPDHQGEQWVAAVLMGLGSYLLPMCFTLLGAGVSIVRDIYNRVCESRLAPRDMPLSFGRLALGMVAGAAIGLFYSPEQAAPGGGISGPLSLSASGLAFLAGYGVDSVFQIFDTLLRRLVTSAQSTPPPAQKQP